MEINITMSEFYKKYQAEKLSIIDVREVYEFVSGHIPTAQNLPLSSLEAGYKLLKGRRNTMSSANQVHARRPLVSF